MSPVARTILQQLGGPRFVAMTGASHLVYGDQSLEFSLPPRFATNKANKVRITLDPSDTYTVDFYRFSPRKLSIQTISSHDCIFADTLRPLFTAQTGLDCSL